MCVLFAEEITIGNINIFFIWLLEVYTGLVKHLLKFFYKMVWKNLNKLFGQPNIFLMVGVEYLCSNDNNSKYHICKYTHKCFLNLNGS